MFPMNPGVGLVNSLYAAQLQAALNPLGHRVMLPQPPMLAVPPMRPSPMLVPPGMRGEGDSFSSYCDNVFNVVRQMK